jgi:hypothetical protein
MVGTYQAQADVTEVPRANLDNGVDTQPIAKYDVALIGMDAFQTGLERKLEDANHSYVSFELGDKAGIGATEGIEVYVIKGSKAGMDATKGPIRTAIDLATQTDAVVLVYDVSCGHKVYRVDTADLEEHELSGNPLMQTITDILERYLDTDITTVEIMDGDENSLGETTEDGILTTNADDSTQTPAIALGIVGGRSDVGRYRLGGGEVTEGTYEAVSSADDEESHDPNEDSDDDEDGLQTLDPDSGEVEYLSDEAPVETITPGDESPSGAIRPAYRIKRRPRQ